jgi:hypothetical protein
MGQELLPADSNNVRGYFEDLEFLQLQRRIVSACCPANDGGHPDWGWTESESFDQSCLKRFVPEASALIASRSDRSRPWGWKDPRTTLLLDFWNGLLEDARYILVYRFPWDVADSMQRLGAEVFLRNPEYGYRIWAFYNRRIRDFYAKNSDRCLLISSNALRGNYREFSRLIHDKLRTDVASASLDGIDEPDLLRSRVHCDPLIDLVAAVWPGCIELLSELDSLADISSAALWQARPVRSRLARGSVSGEKPIDLSVVTPCYNHGVFLVEAIASVERSAPSNCELIIVNDGSDQPRTLEILETLRRLGYFITDQQNKGLSAARNSGIALARGRYILTLDADNRIRPKFIEDAVQVLDSSPDVGVIYGGRQDFGLRTVSHSVADFDLALILQGNYIDACAVFRRQMWRDCGGYDAQMSPMEDWELWIHAAERGWRFHHLDYVTFEYRVRPDSLISRVDSVEALEELRGTILRKHPRLSVELLSRLRSGEDRIRTLSSEIQALTSSAAASEEERKALSAEIQALMSRAAAGEQERKSILAGMRTIMARAVASETQRIALLEERDGLSNRLAQCEPELARIRAWPSWRMLESYGRIKYRHLLPFYRLLGLMPSAGQAEGLPNLEMNPDSAGSCQVPTVMNSIALVTANFGGIDEVRALPDHKGIDSFYYTDQSVSEEVARTWTCVIAPSYPRHDFNPRLRAKYFKLQIHRLDEVRNYRWLVWADASLKFKDLSFLTGHASALAGVPAHKRALLVPHPDRATVIEEFEFVDQSILSGHPYLDVRYAKEKMREQVDYFRERGWNVQAKLWSGGIWMVENTELIRQAFDEWWDQNLRFGMEDQLSMPVVLENHGIEPQPLEIDVRQNEYFEITKHINRMM